MAIKRPLCLYDGHSAELKDGDTLDIRTPSNPNLLVNGDFQIAQDGASFTAIASGTYPCDNWVVGATTSAVVNVTQGLDVVMGKYRNYLSFVTTTANTPSSAQYFFVRTTIEGVDFKRLCGQKTTLSFKIYSSIAGIISVCVSRLNSAANYILEFSLSIGWNNCSALIPLDAAQGTWVLNNTGAATIYFWLQNGNTTQVGAKNIWNYTGVYISNSQSNFLATVGNEVRIADVKWEAGLIQTDFVSRDFETELRKCQRYYCKSASYNWFYMLSGNSTVCRGLAKFPNTMRILPATTVTGCYISNTNSSLSNISVYSGHYSTDEITSIYNPAGNFVGGYSYSISYTANARL